MRRAGLARSQRDPEGGFWLARPAREISLADIIAPSTGSSSGCGPTSRWSSTK
jgi:DNA-binding IscR family transcriptional regulator